MRKHPWGSVFVLLLAIPCIAAADDYPRNPDIDVLNYRFSLVLADNTDTIEATAALDVRFLRAGVEELAIDLIGRDGANSRFGMEVLSVRNQDAPLQFTHADDRVTVRLARPSRAQERRTITITYRGVPEDGLVISNNRHGDRTFFGDNFPDRARHWLASIDHPYDKATCEFAVTAPAQYQVVANGVLVEETDLDGGARRTVWRQSVPIATYLMVIGVARFAVEHVERFNGVDIQTWVYAQDRDAGFHDFARARRPLEFFMSRIGPYPYEKLANVQSKTRYGGMENASVIFYSERSVTGERRSEGTITHEIAHQWFGDSVTESDWNHVWLSEGFATYFTQLFNEFTVGRDRLVLGMQSSRRTVISNSQRRPGSPLVDYNLAIADTLTSDAYQKGAWVLHMLRRAVGDENFWAAIREYYQRYRDGNALTEDLQRVFEATSGLDLDRFFRQWVYTPGQPRLAGGWTWDQTARRLTVRVNQTQPGEVFVTPLDVGIRSADGSLEVRTVQLTGRNQEFSFQLDDRPGGVELDPGVWLLFEDEFENQ